MNNFQQRFRQNNLTQQGANMLAQQQDYNNWYDLGKSVGGAFFPNMANGKSDGMYNGSIVVGTGKTDKENFDFANKFGGESYVDPNANSAIYDKIANDIDGFFSTDENGGKTLNLEAIKNGVLSGNNSYLSQGMNKTGNASDFDWRQYLGGGLKWLQNNMNISATKVR